MFSIVSKYFCKNSCTSIQSHVPGVFCIFPTIVEMKYMLHTQTIISTVIDLETPKNIFGKKKKPTNMRQVDSGYCVSKLIISSYCIFALMGLIAVLAAKALTSGAEFLFWCSVLNGFWKRASITLKDGI